LDNNLRFWDVRSGKDIKELTGIHLGQITSVSVSPGNSLFKSFVCLLFWSNLSNSNYIYFKDGAKVLTNSRDNTLKIVDLKTYEVEQTLQYVHILLVNHFF